MKIRKCENWYLKVIVPDDLKFICANALYTTKDYNKLINLTAKIILKNILSKLNELKFYLIILDEIRDVRCTEQFGVFVYFVESNGTHKGFFPLDSFDALTIVNKIQNFLLI